VAEMPVEVSHMAKKKIGSYSHHAAMLALYVEGEADVSIVQAIKSSKVLDELQARFDALLAQPPEDDGPDDDTK